MNIQGKNHYHPHPHHDEHCQDDDKDHKDKRAIYQPQGTSVCVQGGSWF